MTLQEYSKILKNYGYNQVENVTNYKKAKNFINQGLSVAGAFTKSGNNLTVCFSGVCKVCGVEYLYFKDKTLIKLLYIKCNNTFCSEDCKNLFYSSQHTCDICNQDFIGYRSLIQHKLWHNPVSASNIKNSRLDYLGSPEFKQNCSRGSSGKPKSKETRDKIASAITGIKRSEVTKWKVRLAQLKNDSRFGNRYKFKDNETTEVPMREILTKLGIFYIQSYRITEIEHPLCVDFYLPKENIIIETDGSYWHCHPRYYSFNFFHKQKKMTSLQVWERDFQRTSQMQQAGYKVLRFWENEFDLEKVKSAIEDIQSPLICS